MQNTQILKRQDKWAFTLVELIVVITILAILWTIAFISLQGYSSQARDSKRLSDIQNIKKSLELFSLNTWKYPEPDDFVTVSYDTQDLWYQWTIGNQVSVNLSRNLNEKPTDPLTESEYTYSRTYGGNEYELLSIYESDLVSQNNILTQTNASNANYPKINGNYNWVYVKAWNTYLPTPSIVNALWTDLDLSQVANSTALESQITTWWENNITNAWIDAKTWWLTNMSIQVFTWELDTILWEDDWWNKVALANKIITAYSSTNLANVWVYKTIVETPVEDLVSLVDTFVLNKDNFTNTTTSTTTTNYSCDATTAPADNGHITYTTWTPTEVDQTYVQDAANCWYTCSDWYTWVNCDVAPLTWWRAEDPNCDIEDIVIGTQTWAWCNSTLWNWFEFWQTDADIWTSNYNGTVWSCYDYNWNNTATCTKWDVTMASNTKANTWFSWTNTNSDTEYANIWWKYYTWSNSSSACPTWRHVPSDNEWETLEEYLDDQARPWTAPNNCRNSTDWRLCDWLWWNGHNAKTDTNNLANALKLPLAGYRSTDGSTFYSRGFSTYLWSSTPISTLAYFRYLTWNNSTVYRYTFSQDYGFSVRCLKD